MDEDGGSSHLLISKDVDKNPFEKRPPQIASEKKLRLL